MMDKSKKYEEKVDLLIKQIQEEKDKVRRLYYIIKCKKLIIQIKKQRDLKQARESFGKQREDNRKVARQESIEARTDIIQINEKIKEIEIQLSKNR